MRVTVKWNTRAWRNTCEELRRFKNMDVPEFVRYRARVVNQDLIKWTPPRSDHPGSDSWPTQKKMGESAVTSDFFESYRTAISLLPRIQAKSPRAGNAYRRYVQAQNFGAVQKMLRDFGVSAWNSLIGILTEADHDATRSHKHGRSMARSIVLVGGSIKRVLQIKLGHVGRWKSGWGTSAAHLGLSPKDWPAWVRRHGNRGSIIDNSRRRDRPSITLINDVEGSRRMDSEEIVGAVLRINDKKMRQELEAIMKWQMKKASHR